MIWEIQTKTTWDTTTVGWNKKRLSAFRTDKNEKDAGISYAVGRSVKWWNSFEKSFGIFL